MFYYERLSEKEKEQVRGEAYFNERVANNLLYGLEEEFAIYTYPIPKSHLGLRRYCFFTFPMRVAYYAVGLYILRLSQDFIQGYYKDQRHIHSKYGGQLLFDNKKQKLTLNTNSIWYKPHYGSFRKQVQADAEDIDDKIVVRMDIQSYFEEISIPILLDFLSNYVKPSIKKDLQFDPITQRQITDFFSFISNGRTGIPQTDNDVISSFVGHLYLAFSDLLLDQEIREHIKGVNKYSIIRYMDDIYLFITFHKDVSEVDREIYIRVLLCRISDCFYQNLGLRLNTKTKVHWLYRDLGQKDDLLRNLKRTSPGYELPDESKKTTPKDKVESIFGQLEKLKKITFDLTSNEQSGLDTEIFKEIYDESVRNLFNSTGNKKRINKTFTDFDFARVIFQPKAILTLLLIDSIATKKFTKFLLDKRKLTSSDINLILNFLCQTDFKSKKLIKLLEEDTLMYEIMRVFSKSKISVERPGYFALGNKQVLKIAENPNVIEQIRLRVQCERRKEYSVGLNHLLNEICAICYVVHKPSVSEKAYNANEVEEFLVSRKVSHDACLKIRNLFDRRNKNPVSHADPIAWPVSREEYLDYHHYVAICLNHLL